MHRDFRTAMTIRVAIVSIWHLMRSVAGAEGRVACLGMLCSSDALQGKVRSFGGLSDSAMAAIVARCLARMKAWYQVMLSVVKSEFPDFDIIRSFNALSLAKERKDVRSLQGTAADAAQADDRNIQRLALLLKADPCTLAQQVRDHRPIARKVFLDTKCSTFEAWKSAYQKTQRHASSRGNHPADLLLQLLMAYGCAVTDDLDILRFHSSTQKGMGTGATNITKATRQAWQEFCTVGHGAHKSKRPPSPEDFKKELYDHIRNITKQLIIDSASDEKLSGRQMIEALWQVVF